MAIQFREINFGKDSGAVVDLINENLKSGFTVDILKWKHLYGPFGPSSNVIAVDGDKIVAVVFAMRYNYKNLEGKVVKGIRTFDGCTDIEYRGKGIFKKIMKLCVDKFALDYDFLMANPNEASFPEHIKLGYVEPPFEYSYRVGIINPFGRSLSNQLKDFEKKDPKNFKEKSCSGLSKESFYLTGNDLEFLNWRYYPENYNVKMLATDEGVNYLVYRIIKRKGIKALVLCDFYGGKTRLSEMVRSVAKIEKTYFIYYLQNAINEHLDLILSKKDKKAVIVFKLNAMNLPENLVISLGDLEGRL